MRTAGLTAAALIGFAANSLLCRMALRPGRSAPDPAGAALMIAAGVAWGAYSLRGRGASRPLVATASNFARAVPLALALSLADMGSVHVSPRGALLAVASGALSSGIG